MASQKQEFLDAVREPNLASLGTLTEDGKPWVRYVMIRGGRDATLRFACFLNSRKVAQIRKNPEVHLTCGATDLGSRQPYLQIQGRAEVCTDPAERGAFWHEGLERYFEGPDDPNYCVVQVSPYRIERMKPDSLEPEVWEGGA